jgi:hypothetical protein
MARTRQRLCRLSGARLDNLNAVAHATGVLLVVRHILLGAPNGLAVERVAVAACDGDHDGFVHLIADYHADAHLASPLIGRRLADRRALRRCFLLNRFLVHI